MYQQITLIGNIGSDPEMRYTKDGTPVSNFSLAVNKSWVAQDGSRKERTTWFRVACWRTLAEVVAQHLSKGRKVLVVGEMEDPHTWTDGDGTVRAALEVTAQVVRFLDAKAPNGSAPNESPNDLPDF